jgi:hypothetical protein
VPVGAVSQRAAALPRAKEHVVVAVDDRDHVRSAGSSE